MEELVPTVMFPDAAVVTACKEASKAFEIVKAAGLFVDPTALLRVTSPTAPALRASVVSLDPSSMVPAMVMSSVSAPPDVIVVVMAPPPSSTVSLVIDIEPAEVKLAPDIVTPSAPEILMEAIELVAPTLPEKLHHQILRQEPPGVIGIDD